MKILQLITRSELRGAEVFAAQLSERLAERGHDVTLAALYAPFPDGIPLNTQGINRVELGGKRKGHIEPKLLYRLIQLCRELRPDVVQANAFHALKYIALTKKLKQYSGAIVYRNISISSRWITRKGQRAWGKWLLRSADSISSVCDSGNQDFCETYHLSPELVTTIRRGIDIPKILLRETTRKKISNLIHCHLDDPMLFHIGGFTEEKNHIGLLNAFSQIKQDQPHSQLLLIGEGPLRFAVKQEIQKRDLSKHVHLLGARDDVRDLLVGADLMLLPSKIEGIPGVILEASVREVPSIATNVGGVSEAVHDGQTGILVAADDMDKLAKEACKLIADPQKRQQMGKAAKVLITERHSMEKCVDLHETLYQSLTSTR